MTDYIRKAVELADGWRIKSGMNLEIGSTWFIKGPDKWLKCLLSEPKGYMLDALAAQIERQFLEAVEMTQHISYFTEMRRQPIGTDLTDWRINYIIDSKVLA